MAKKKLTASSADYEIGRSKPPRSSQFKPGQSGNPGGRKKGSRNFKTMFWEVYDSEIEISEGGRARAVPMLKAVMLRQAQEGLRGHARTMENILDRADRYSDTDTEQIHEPPEEDEALIRRALDASRRRRRQ